MIKAACYWLSELPFWIYMARQGQSGLPMVSRTTASGLPKPTMDSNFALQSNSAHDAPQPLALPVPEAPRDMGDANARKLIWFLVPSWDVCGGGLLSICYFHAETRMLLGGLGVAIVASTYPNAPTLKKYTA